MASSEVMEPEFYALAPEGVCTLTTRINLPKMTTAAIKEMLRSRQLEECTRLLARAKCDVILFGGTSCSFLGGPKWELELLERMKTMAGGITVINTAQSSTRALQAVGAKKVVIATPYTDDINEAGVDYFTKQGFEVLQCTGMGYDDDLEIAGIPLAKVYHLVRDTDMPEAEAVFISCTNLKTLPLIGGLETDLRKPVVSAVQASLWYALKVVGVSGVVSAGGSLFAK
jgi:maleate isomerase